MQDLARFRVEHLFLLVGSNPLPNYVAAQLLAIPPAELVLVYSDGVVQHRDRLTRELGKKGYTRIAHVRVEESNPTDVLNRIAHEARGRSGSVGLHYTGGTKAMSVHAYRALEQTVGRVGNNQRLFYSYLDARHLRLWVEGTALTGSHPISVRSALKVSIQEMLDLHGLTKLKTDMRTNSHWSRVSQSLAAIHADGTRATRWRDWGTGLLRDSTPKRELLDAKKLGHYTTDDFPFQEVRDALQEELPELTFPVTFRELAASGQLSKPSKSFAQWFDGAWLEHYVFDCLDHVRNRGKIDDVALNINPLLGRSDSEFEFDVGCTRGYQLFALSCTTAGLVRYCKPKLLEAVVRAQQLGGAEARIALVCCAEPEDVERLRTQVVDLLGENRVRVFGRQDLLQLEDRLEEWLDEA